MTLLVHITKLRFASLFQHKKYYTYQYIWLLTNNYLQLFEEKIVNNCSSEEKNDNSNELFDKTDSNDKEEGEESLINSGRWHDSEHNKFLEAL